MTFLKGSFLAAICLACSFSTPARAPAWQSSSSNGQTESSAAKTAAQTQTPASQEAAQKPPKRTKRVWTNEEISTVGSERSISVVGNGASPEVHVKSTSPRAHEQQITVYRERLHQLRAELEITEKKISDLRNFKAENASSSGGINMSRRYSMTPVEDQVKSLEERKRQLQGQIDGVEEQARKSGVEPGELR